MAIPYRTRRAFKRLTTVLLALALVTVFVLICWLLWLDRFIVYTKDGAFLDFSQDNKLMSGQLAGPAEQKPTVPIHFGDDDVAVTTQLQQMIGYYIAADDLSASQNSRNPQEESAQKIDTLIAKIRKLPAGTPVMLEVKNIKGRFFYDSSVGSQRYSLINTQKVDELISVINQQNLYLIAQLPAFRDYYYGLNNVPHGLHHSSGRYLWMDDAGCYWLNPAHQGTITYLAQILTELKGLGFDEAVFSDFCFPNTTNILFNGDKAATIENAAKTIALACASDTFAVSFIGAADFPLPEGRCRLYVENIAAADCQSLAEQIGFEKPEINLVFIAQSHDTRYDKYSVLRHLD